ncbi:MAG: PilT/PilU family type 4a pilus ATPase [Myxococcales bacterium]|nr:PilT/PilU family type 4a pilus ATPase [Myxococcales bacterium]
MGFGFGGNRRSVLQQVEQGRWKNDEERKELLNQLREAGLKPADALGLIWHADAGVRQAASEMFISRADVSAAMLLARDMGKRTSAQRTYAGRIFNRLPEDTVRPVVENLLTDKLPKVRQLGWEVALALGGQIGIEYLQKAVREGPVAMRGTALRRLLQLVRPDRIIELLVQAAKSDDSRLASTAVQALADIDDPRIMALMVDRFAEGDAAVREQATKWLLDAAVKHPKEVRASMFEMLSRGDDATRRQGVQILLETGETAEILAELLLFLNDLLGWLRDRIIDTLRTFGDSILRASVALLSHPEDSVRTLALVLAESFNDKRLVGPLCRMLKDDDWWLKITACDSLGRLGDERAVPFLAEALKDDDCNWAAIDSLAQIGSKQALNPLAQLLRQDREELRMEVVRAFSRFTDERLIQLLKVVKAQDPSTDVRTRASEVLRDMAARLDIDIEGDEARAAVSADSLGRPIDRLLAKAREMGASDIHISTDEPPMIRMGGKLSRLPDHPKLSGDETRAWVRSILSEKQLTILDDAGEIDFCHSIKQVGRYRANAYEERLGMSATFRTIPNQPPTFSDIGLPGHLTELLDYHQGIIVVSGPSGSGKSTTLAAIINLINETKADHVLTLEDPIEFVHPVKSALVNQREIGKHSDSFHAALRGALREDPDVIMVGELRDAEVIRMALEAAETGHLVVTTMHTTSAVQTVERLVSSFPPEEQMQVRMGLSEALKFVICQSLVPKREGGRVAVFEILKGTFNVGSLIRDDKTFQLSSMMQIGRNVGMQTVDMALMDLVESNVITPEAAWMRAENQDMFAPLCPPDFLEAQGG